MLNPDRAPADRIVPDPERGRYVLHLHRNAEVWTWASAVAIAGALRRNLDADARARLVAGADPDAAPVYRALSQAPLDWQRVDVGLVDERWLQSDDPESHAWRVRGELIRHHAASARFEPLTQPGRPIEEAVGVANMHARQPASVVVLGMGTDGHLGSLFPRMSNLDRVLASREAYAAVNADGCPSALEWPRRITLTPAGLARAHCRVLLIRGREKRSALEYALASDNMESWPVLAALDSPATPLQVHWCA